METMVVRQRRYREINGSVQRAFRADNGSVTENIMKTMVMGQMRYRENNGSVTKEILWRTWLCDKGDIAKTMVV